MAIGLGKIFGFDFSENFNYPYAANSITDFWRRWHISLTTWFRDYLYIPLGGNRCSKARWVRNFFIVWFLTGLWHGASWNFIIWGLFYAIVLLIEKQFLGNFLKRIPSLLSWIYMFVIVNCGWLLFRVNSLSNLKVVVHSFVYPTVSISDFLSNNFIIVPYLWFMVIGLIFIFPVKKYIIMLFEKFAFGRIALDLILIMLFLVAIFALIGDSYNPFIYFRF